MDAPALVFLIFMGVNGLVSGISGNMWHEVLNEILPVAEVFFTFILVSRVRWDEARATRTLRLILIAVSLRGALQLVLTFSGHPVIPPIYAPWEKFHAEVYVGNFWYVRLIDPVCGLFFAISLFLFLRGVERRLSGVTAILCGAVSVLGLTRSQWLASALVLCLFMWFTRHRKIARNFLLITGATAASVCVLLVVSSDLLEFAQQRLVNYTIEQVTDTGNERDELRILEVDTAVEKFKQAPLLGHGLGSRFGTVVDDGSGPELITLHNYYLGLMTNTGLLGLVFFAWVISRAIKVSLALVRTSRSDFDKTLSLCAVGSLAWWGIFMAFMAIHSAYHVTVLIGGAYGMATALALPYTKLALSKARVEAAVSGGLVSESIQQG